MVHKRITITKTQKIDGIATSNVKNGENGWMLVKGVYTSDQPEFFEFGEGILDHFLSLAEIPADAVSQCLILVHQDLNVDLYINDFPISVEMRVKRNFKKGEAVSTNDIADIRALMFPDSTLEKTDKVICCLKVGWKFGLYFNFNNDGQLSIDDLQLDLGKLFRKLRFYKLYNVFEKQRQFDQMLKDGWFPFVELIGQPYDELVKLYVDKFNYEERIGTFLNKFDREKIEALASRWWVIPAFNNKKALIEAGLSAYYQNDASGFINCIKTLTSEIEGIMRLDCYTETNKTKIKFDDLSKHVFRKALSKSSSSSLFFPDYFLKYLDETFFANFDLGSGSVELSRHSSLHGVAKEGDYSKAKALQTILVLDQLHFYLS